jgi:hypothetical protein
MAAKAKAAIIFEGSQPERVRRAVRELGEGLVPEMTVDLNAAFEGSYEAARRYVLAYRDLTSKLLCEAAELKPDIAIHTSSYDTVLEAKFGTGKSFLSVLEDASTQAPFSPFAGQYDLGDAVALELTNQARVLLGFQGLTARAGKGAVHEIDELAARRFLHNVRHHLNQLDDDSLVQVMEAFELSKTELGALFGVSRQAIDGWLRNGVPADRREKLNTSASLMDLLERKLKPGRLPGVARTPADAYGGLTMLEMVAGDRHRELLDDVRESFDWSSAA